MRTKFYVHRHTCIWRLKGKRKATANRVYKKDYYVLKSGSVCVCVQFSTFYLI